MVRLGGAGAPGTGAQPTPSYKPRSSPSRGDSYGVGGRLRPCKNAIRPVRRPPPQLTKPDLSRISRANCLRGAVSRPDGSFRSQSGAFLALSEAFQPNFHVMPGFEPVLAMPTRAVFEPARKRRMNRETDLSTLEAGAQAPSRFPCPPGHHRRPQGSRRPSCPWPQAPERLTLFQLQPAMNR